MKYRFQFIIFVAFLLLLIHIFLDTTILAQQTDLDTAVKAVVRIVPQICKPTRCDPTNFVGSGVVIDPSGIILTVWHLTQVDPENTNVLAPEYVDDFVIQMTD